VVMGFKIHSGDWWRCHIRTSCREFHCTGSPGHGRCDGLGGKVGGCSS
jgi:hypothetical protein